MMGCLFGRQICWSFCWNHELLSTRQTFYVDFIINLRDKKKWSTKVRYSCTPLESVE